MDNVILWAGNVGAWLLVFGPLYQGAIELQSQVVDHEDIASAFATSRYPDPPSPWWWLLPPIMLVLRYRDGLHRQKGIAARLTASQRDQLAGYLNKATGWFTVASGGTLLAVKETWELFEHNNWSTWLFVVVVIVVMGLASFNTAVRMSRFQSWSDSGRT